jgi:hypothetical protein
MIAVLISVGVIVCGVALNILYFGCCFVTVFLLGIKSETVDRVQFWASFAAAIVVTLFLLHRVRRMQIAKPGGRARQPEDFDGGAVLDHPSVSAETGGSKRWRL